MAGTVSPVLKLESIIDWPDSILSKGFKHMALECCVVSLDSNNHKSGTNLKSDSSKTNIMPGPYVLEWDLTVDDALKNTHRDENRTTDFGSMCLALLLANELILANGIWMSSKKGEGVDFWLIDPMTFTAIARLEISGLRKETPSNTLANRIKVKLKQVEQSDDSGVSAYIAIIEYSKPSAVFMPK